MKIVINRCFGGFGISEAGYAKLIEWGVPVKKYTKQTRDESGIYKQMPENEGEIIFDRLLTPEKERDSLHGPMMRLDGRYWETWLYKQRTHPLLIRVVKELGEAVNGNHAKLKVVEIPDGVEWEIDECHGLEKINEKHRSWS